LRLLAWFGAAAAAADPDGGIGPANVTSSRDGPVPRPATPNSRDINSRSGAGLTAHPARRPAFGAGGTIGQGTGGKASRAQQAKLENTIGRLDAALAKAQREAAGAISTVKYMQVNALPQLLVIMTWLLQSVRGARAPVCMAAGAG
jgi:hypothetical protein